MSVIRFPSPVLTEEEETIIISEVFFSGGFSCQRGTNDRGDPSITLITHAHQVGGHITKKRGVYMVLDARGMVITQSRHLKDILSAIGL